ncbi:transposase [Streptomyces sp. Edi2]|uniref:transposase n=1 Tax=Streptomyces sp. Edi2 TaxID=3162528 RepID=UPI003306541E
MGGRWQDPGRVINTIAFNYRTGCPWMDLPAEFGSWNGTHNRLRKWAADGTWHRIFTALLAQTDAQGDLDVGAPSARDRFCPSHGAAGVVRV